MKKVGKIVFYKFYDEKKNIVEASYLFFTDGTARLATKEEGLSLVPEITKEEGIHTADALSEYINKDDSRIYTMSGNEFAKRFNSFLIKPKEEARPVDFKSSFASDAKSVFEEDEDIDLDSDNEEFEEIEEKKPGKIKSFIKRFTDRIKKSKLAKKITVTALAIAICFGLATNARNTKKGQMVNSNIDYSQTVTDENLTNDEIISEFEILLARTTVASQKDAMTLMSDNLDYFNGTFADKFVEEGKNIRAALSWDEMMALQLAYNDYSKDEIKAIFNGYELDSKKFDGYYKNANLQLMGAYILETRDTQVDSYKYIRDVEGQEFVKKYNEMFLQCKEATGKEKVELVNKFYQEIHKDFPISDDIRETGISHSDPRGSIKQYKIAITPIVTAAEMIFQNLEIDHTLSDKAIAYFNDLGFCNLAVNQFERAKTILLAANTDTTQPLYEEFRNAKIKELEAKGIYITEDKSRNLNELDAFNLIVNKQVDMTSSNYFEGATSSKTTTSTSTRTESSTSYRTESKTTTTNDRKKAVEMTSEEAVRNAEKEVDKQVERENAANKKKAEEEAEKKRQELQKEADEQAKKNEEAVKKDDKDFQDKINQANDKKNNGGTVNEKDFGDHNVKFDDDKKDNNGNLNDSIKDITTDGSGANTPLPDPNETGAKFDAKAPAHVESAPTPVPTPSTNNNSSSSSNSSGEGFYTEEVTTKSAPAPVATPAPVSTPAPTTAPKQSIIEYEEPVKTNEQIVDEYIQSLENESNENNISKVYKK